MTLPKVVNEVSSAPASDFHVTLSVLRPREETASDVFYVVINDHDMLARMLTREEGITFDRHSDRL